MNGYMGALKKFIPVLQNGGKTKRRRRKKKRKTKKKYN
jgi:hypothetical protein